MIPVEMEMMFMYPVCCEVNIEAWVEKALEALMLYVNRVLLAT